MFTVTIEVADADELLKLATCIQAGFCEVQGRNIAAALAANEQAAAKEDDPHTAEVEKPKRTPRRRKNRDADEPPAMVPDAGEPVPEVSLEDATKAVRDAMQRYGLPAVRSVLIDLGLKDVMSASPAERGELVAALRKLQ